ncbi:Serine/threonine-protein kinase pknF [Mycolicibacterium fortuitum]|uniref:non-specific serine/threonine protein kinase n=1 Tax=Mycolicibacterium fortuitum TaxID=1766 RepID=A0A378WF33_MYCFO|nr:Serine/threonine-protein kinase pknF [Mycolicibacterium fortuitum]
MDDTNGLTATSTTIGTIAYSAPEQLMGEPIDGRADQYALAATAYHLLTGTTLFPLDNQAAVISHHLTAPPPTLAAKNPELAAIDTVLARALSKKPEQRYARCVDFARAFHEATTSQGAAALAPTTQAPTTAAESQPPQAAAAAPPKKPAAPKQPDPPATATPALHNRRRVVALGAAATVAIIAVPAIATWRPWDTPTTPPPTVSASPALEATPAADQPTQPLPPPTTPTPKHGVAGMVVMLDPALSGGDDHTAIAQPVEDGRGGTTACQEISAATQSGYPEHTFAWDTTLRTRALLNQKGVRTAMTRGNDNKMGPCVDERAAIANNLPMPRTPSSPSAPTTPTPTTTDS